MSDIQPRPDNTDKSVITSFLDDEDPDNIAIYLVRETLDEEMGYIPGSAVQAHPRFGWRMDPGNWLKRREEYGDVGEHSLLTDEEAQGYLDTMGLNLEDGKRLLIKRFNEVNGYDPVILPVDPDFRNRRNTARAQLGLPSKR